MASAKTATMTRPTMMKVVSCARLSERPMVLPERRSLNIFAVRGPCRASPRLGRTASRYPCCLAGMPGILGNAADRDVSLSGIYIRSGSPLGRQEHRRLDILAGLCIRRRLAAHDAQRSGGAIVQGTIAVLLAVAYPSSESVTRGRPLIHAPGLKGLLDRTADRVQDVQPARALAALGIAQGVVPYARAAGSAALKLAAGAEQVHLVPLDDIKHERGHSGCYLRKRAELGIHAAELLRHAA